jgi:hypothetical protein
VLGDRHAPALIRIVRRAPSWPGRRGGRSFLGREEALRRRGSFTFRSRRQTFGREPKARREELVAGFIVPLLDGSMPLQMDQSPDDGRRGAGVRPATAVGIFTICYLAFLTKSFHADDPLFICVAKQIAGHPLDFYGFEANWAATARPFHLITKNPPLASYYMAAFGSIFGWSEPKLLLADSDTPGFGRAPAIARSPSADATLASATSRSKPRCRKISRALSKVSTGGSCGAASATG